jgi:uncharacterized protein YjbJ (UPF0337 family)
MDREHVKCAADKAKGAVKDGAGKMMDDKKLQAEGKIDKAKGEAREAPGPRDASLSRVSVPDLAILRGRGLQAQEIESRLTAMGKDERAISVSGYVHQGLIKYSDRAFNKTVVYKKRSRNHLLEQVESFRVGDPRSDREDDLLDTFCYGIALALGNNEGF